MAGTFLTFCDFAGKNLPLGNRPGCFADFICGGSPPILCCTEEDSVCLDDADPISDTIEVTIGSEPLISSAQVWIDPLIHNPLTDTLTFATIGPISGSYNPTTGILTLTGLDTAANYQAALRTVTYQYSA
jgi:hypothetical protein